jgi:hypothetical protein
VYFVGGVYGVAYRDRKVGVFVRFRALTSL